MAGNFVLSEAMQSSIRSDPLLTLSWPKQRFHHKVVAAVMCTSITECVTGMGFTRQLCGEFQPYIDRHKGKVKQIVSCTLSDQPRETAESLVTNFESNKSAAEFGKLLKRNGLRRPVRMPGQDRKTQAAAVKQVAAFPEEGVTVLVIGGGGREHALCYGLRRSKTCDGVFCAPGNTGISAADDATCISDLDVTNSAAVISFCRKWEVGLVVVGPEAPLVAGLVDDLQEAGITAFGPSAAAAALEGSKDFMKRLCLKYGIPTAKYKSFSDAVDAKRYIEEMGTPIVVKADGLAAGKGVIIAMTLEDAFAAVDSMLVDKVFGKAGGLVIIEEFLDGEEISFFALVDGESAIPFASAQDHKRVGDGDSGPNTGGMGAYSPSPALTPDLESIVMDSIIMPTVKGMALEGCRFVGILYAGLIIDKKTGLPKLLEYNVRFGDPECQVLITRFQSDLAHTLLAACRGKLKELSLCWSEESSLVVVLASKGYPGHFTRGTVIKNLDEAETAAPKVKIFHAGTAVDSQGNIVASGGRVLGVVAMGKDIVQAQNRAYQAVDEIIWPEGFCRRDIGWRAVARLRDASKEMV